MTLGQMKEMLTALEIAIAQGVLEVRYADKWLKYQNTTAMITAMRNLKQQIASLEGRPTYGFYRIDVNKGKGGS